VQNHACQRGYALADLGGNGYPSAAIFRQQGASWMFVYVLAEFNYCQTEQHGKMIHSCKGGPSQALLKSLYNQLHQAIPPPVSAGELPGHHGTHSVLPGRVHGIRALSCRRAGVDPDRDSAGSQVHDVSAEAPCAELTSRLRGNSLRWL
jgi:hypothetical protein